VRTSN